MLCHFFCLENVEKYKRKKKKAIIYSLTIVVLKLCGMWVFFRFSSQNASDISKISLKNYPLPVYIEADPLIHQMINQAKPCGEEGNRE